MRVLDVSWSGCNPSCRLILTLLQHSPQKEYLFMHGHGVMNTKEFYWCIDRTLDFKPHLTLDDGADLIFTVHNKHRELFKKYYRWYRRNNNWCSPSQKNGRTRCFLNIRDFAVNDSITKWDFDNVYGTGQRNFYGIYTGYLRSDYRLQEFCCCRVSDIVEV